MKPKQKKLVRTQLDETLKRLKVLEKVIVPRKGWIRAIRNALGMTGEQLAKRLNVNQQRIARIEQDEILGKVTLNTMKNVADALQCKFVYGFIPNTSLEQIVKNQAIFFAKKRILRSNQMMRLEKQELSQIEKEKALNDLVREIIDTMPKSLWNEINQNIYEYKNDKV